MFRQKLFNSTNLKNAMRNINKIIIHCTATPEGRPVSVKEVDRWHKQRGWKGIGYHYLIGLNGEVWEGRQVDEVGAHCEGQNSNSIGVCYVGGCDAKMNAKDTRTQAQKSSLVKLLKQLKARFPGVKIFGHRDFSTKLCPSFDAKKEYEKI